MNSNNDMSLLDQALSVGEITRILKTFIKERFYNLRIIGEISSFKPSQNGHWYFTLKDNEAQLSAVMFRSANALCSFRPENGDLVEVCGSFDVYEARGTYQVIIQSMSRAGRGAILAELQKKKEYYESLGWFESQGKPPLPLFPKNIGIVTATTGAAIQDMLNTTKRYAPSVDITVYPVLVQGESAAELIASAIRQANELFISDVLIVGRGGGSMEDLLPFSSDEVIRAIHESEIPIISAVGHETDTSLSDYVATWRAITPTDGATKACEGYKKIRETLGEVSSRLEETMMARYYRNRSHLISFDGLRAIIESKARKFSPPDMNTLEGLVLRKLDSLTLRLSYASDGALEALKHGFERKEARLEGLFESGYLAFGKRFEDSLTFEKNLIREAGLAMKEKETKSSHALEVMQRECEALSPLSVLERGYAIVFDEKDRIVKSKKDTTEGSALRIRVRDGEIDTVVRRMK